MAASDAVLDLGLDAAESGAGEDLPVFHAALGIEVEEEVVVGESVSAAHFEGGVVDVDEGGVWGQVGEYFLAQAGDGEGDAGVGGSRFFEPVAEVDGAEVDASVGGAAGHLAIGFNEAVDQIGELLTARGAETGAGVLDFDNDVVNVGAEVAENESVEGEGTVPVAGGAEVDAVVVYGFDALGIGVGLVGGSGNLAREEVDAGAEAKVMGVAADVFHFVVEGLIASGGGVVGEVVLIGPDVEVEAVSVEGAQAAEVGLPLVEGESVAGEALELPGGEEVVEVALGKVGSVRAGGQEVGGLEVGVGSGEKGAAEIVDAVG